ncbi:hypothetical protein EIO_1631 [Ketogulonicigenium vulgare Y25]|uniref:Uncharacterized protein n=1 Tax=Ketogulonicigenium vulgare (strain WSH-001) TaxID=759362 RepID=F9Y6S5_KETVW|nr:hypothetical protein EIO_1631 [Ketogulonicigenium vulgare Y25]AEM40942.1 hypothetical protein KVU_1103 [Ketogulonicigenium vulgare WSH-001]ALJ81095.1 hypothetical protein KVH_07845 [Ketogulonicigenium vulgare]ANW35044.1 hypothetical protein KvSKV_07810 [Ketogulonicigenium vulgare]AOZ54667.1 hypothetical protein KVC_1654 [Ketogulonicigenium vulgare]
MVKPSVIALRKVKSADGEISTRTVVYFKRKEWAIFAA